MDKKSPAKQRADAPCPAYFEVTGRSKMTPRARAKAMSVYSHNYSAFVPGPSAKVLDIGCSEGIALEWLHRSGCTDLAGVDSDPVAIGRAAEHLSGRVPREALVCSDALDFLRSQRPAAFDRVFMLNVVEHIEKETLLEVISEIKRVLRPGGLYIAQTGNMENPLNYGLFANDFTHRIAFTAESLKQAMVLGGFSPRSVGIFPVRYRTSVTNWPFQIAGPVAGLLLKTFALSMRIRIGRTEALIFSVARKE